MVLRPKWLFIYVLQSEQNWVCSKNTFSSLAVGELPLCHNTTQTVESYLIKRYLVCYWKRIAAGRYKSYLDIFVELLHKSCIHNLI